MDVHYTWIGPPPADRNRDLNAPKALAARCSGQSVKTYFWCLDAQVAAYERDFAAHKNVTVRGGLRRGGLSPWSTTCYLGPWLIPPLSLRAWKTACNSRG